ncbi:MAG: B12-binding domain-containing radical SAM protein [Micromonosporaceae bacterium]
MSKGRILFVFAPTLDPHDRFFNCYPGSLLHAVAPLVDAVDRGVVDIEYVPVVFHPKIFTDRSLTAFREILTRFRPTHLAISSTYDSWHVALRLAREARHVAPDIITIHGGPHLDEVLEPFVLQRMPGLDPFSGAARDAVDFAIGGDGEYVLLKLIADTAGASDPADAQRRVAERLDDYRSLPGTGSIAFPKDDEKVIVRFRTPMNLDDIPFVPRHLLPVADLYDFDCFRNETGQRLSTVTMITHRGCRARCTFCSEGLPYQARSLDHILAEARQLRARDVDAIFIDDSTVQDDPEHMKMFAELHALGFRLGALTRFDLLQDASHVREMRQHGVEYLYASIEQYDDSSLQDMHKGVTTRQIDRGIENLRSAGIKLGVSLLFGLPDETPRSVDGTLGYVRDLAAEDAVEYVSLSLFSYHPRTPLGSMHRDRVRTFQFDGGPPNLRYPYTGFEEGSWYHPEHVTDDYTEDLLLRAKAGFGGRLVREIAKHRGSLGHDNT